MTDIQVIYALIIMLAVITMVIAWYVVDNRDGIAQNLSYIKQNKELINRNAQLIHIINVMLSNSNLKVEWEKYCEKLKKLGIVIDDPHRNLDIEDPEG